MKHILAVIEGTAACIYSLNISWHLAVHSTLQECDQPASTCFLTLCEMRYYQGIRRITSWSHLPKEANQLVNRDKPTRITLQRLVDVPLKDTTLAVVL